jgi:sulfur carrier protein
VITVNGQPRDLPEGTPVAAVVAELVGGSGGRGVAVALNGEVVPRTAWTSTVVGPDDRVEVLTASQGG